MNKEDLRAIYDDFEKRTDARVDDVDDLIKTIDQLYRSAYNLNVLEDVKGDTDIYHTTIDITSQLIREAYGEKYARESEQLKDTVIAAANQEYRDTRWRLL